QQRVQRAFIDRQPKVLQGLAQRVAIVLLPKLGQHGDDQASAAKLQLQVLKELRIGLNTGLHTVCITHYVIHSIIVKWVWRNFLNTLTLCICARCKDEWTAGCTDAWLCSTLPTGTLVGPRCYCLQPIAAARPHWTTMSRVCGLIAR